MPALFQLSKDRPVPKSGQSILKAGEAADYLTALELLAELKTRGEESNRAAEEIYQKRREEGYQEGLEAGREEYADKIMDTVLSSVEYLENLEERLVKLVGEVTRKLLGEMDSRELIVRLVRQALTTVRAERKVLIRVAAREEAAVRDGLAGLLKRPDGGSDFLELVADPDLPPGSCLLESEMGVVEASLETQLRNLEKALLRRVKSS
jgi:type III secretion protein L